MTKYALAMLRERRFSMKILAHKVRRYLPNFCYTALLYLRYATFPRSCRNVDLPEISYSDGTWAERKTTADLLRIEALLKAHPGSLAVLQIGIGNSSLFAAIGNTTRRFVGLTVVEDELRYARDKFPDIFGSRYDARLMNKYSSTISELAGEFDYIVDNDISAYACCHHHFGEMLEAYCKLLTPNGAVLIGIKGMGYFDSGFGLTPLMLTKIAARHGLVFKIGPDCHRLTRPHS